MSRKNDYAKRKGRNKSLPFVQLHHWMLRTDAWRKLDPTARALYIEIKTRFTGGNNGEIGLGCREAGEALGVSFPTAARAFTRLREHGFIDVGTPSGFNVKNRVSTEWLITEARDDRNGEMPRKDFMRWAPTVAPVKPFEKTTVSNESPTVAPVKLSGNGIPQTEADSCTSETVNADLPEPQFHQRNTYTSSHRHGAAKSGRRRDANQTASASAPGPSPSSELINTKIVARLQRMDGSDA